MLACGPSHKQAGLANGWHLQNPDNLTNHRQIGRQTLLRVQHNERADRAVITATPEAHMAMGVLARLHLLTLEQVTCRHVEHRR